MYIILVAHGNLSVELLNTAEMICGKQNNCATVSFIPGENVETLKRKYNDILKEVEKTEQVLIAVDLFGGSPYNAGFELALQNETIDVITGLSIPMLLEIFTERENDGLKATDVINKIHPQEYIRSCKQLLKQMQKYEEEDL